MMSNRVSEKELKPCPFCGGGKPLVIGDTNDKGIAIKYPNTLIAYGYDIHGSGSNGLTVKINNCPMCARKLPKEQEG